jgi:hypothetical protein
MEPISSKSESISSMSFDEFILQKMSQQRQNLPLPFFIPEQKPLSELIQLSNSKGYQGWILK